jgi:hypothetical protein
MRHLITRASMTLLVTSGMLAIGATSALANGSAPAPSCQSYNSMIYCWATAGSSPFTWTETVRADGTSYSSTFVATDISGGCQRGTGFTFSYSYVSGGVTYDSASTEVTCNTYPPE